MLVVDDRGICVDVLIALGKQLDKVSTVRAFVPSAGKYRSLRRYVQRMGYTCQYVTRKSMR